jgi:hypothetical protein
VAKTAAATRQDAVEAPTRTDLVQVAMRASPAMTTDSGT